MQTWNRNWNWLLIYILCALFLCYRWRQCKWERYVRRHWLWDQRHGRVCGPWVLSMVSGIEPVALVVRHEHEYTKPESPKRAAKIRRNQRKYYSGVSNCHTLNSNNNHKKIRNNNSNNNSECCRIHLRCHDDHESYDVGGEGVHSENNEEKKTPRRGQRRRRGRRRVLKPHK